MHPSQVPAVTADSIPAGAAVLDCREAYEWQAGHIAGAVHIPMNLIPQRLAAEPGTLPADVPVVVVCKVGSRSAYVAAWLIQHGYDAVNLDGGMLAWASGGRPMQSADGSPPHVA